MNRRHYIGFISILTAVCCILAPVGTDARSKKKVEEKKETVRRQSPYEKFLSKKGLKKSAGEGIGCYRTGNKIYLELADSLMGSDAILSRRIISSSDFELSPGEDVSPKNGRFILERTDSLIIFRNFSPRVESVDTNVAAALEKSGTGAIQYAFPIKYKSPSGTSFIIDASILFNASETGSVNLYGAYMSGSQIVESDVKSDLTCILDSQAYGRAVSVNADLTFDVKLVTNYEQKLSVVVKTDLVFNRRSSMPSRKTDGRLGLQSIASNSYDSRTGMSKDRIVRRWDLRDGKKITIYVDTLLPEPFFNAAKDGIMAWNPAFEKIGLKDAIQVLPYPSDPSFSASDPCVSTFSFNCNTSRMPLNAYLNSDSRTGEIISCTMFFNGQFVDYMRREAGFSIGDVDSRYFCYNFPDSAIYEYARAKVMTLFGKCLGFSDNYAASLAYTPKQLRDPEFTSSHGITASVMDNVVFNVLARPGDREKGVVTVSDRIGPYDFYAVEWLYGSYDEGPELDRVLDSLILSAQMKPECLYVPYQEGSPDPRANKYDLGSDSFECFDAKISHLKYCMENAHIFLSDNAVPEESYRSLYVEQLWLKMFEAATSLSLNIGGVYASEVDSSSPLKRFVPVPEDVQRKSLNKCLDLMTDFKWMDDNGKLMKMSGLYTTFGGLNYFNALGATKAFSRLPFVCRAERIAGSTYTADKMLADLHKRVFENLSSGALHPMEDNMIGMYISSLVSLSPQLQFKYKKAFHKEANLTGAVGFPVLSYVYQEDVDALPLLSCKYLQKARKDCVEAKTKLESKYDRGRIDYLIYIIDTTINN
ncbi:MAG: zinc-dependent metalloprotease [Rikenellaceae bacterium]|nr:zinc-dependent metalloprotease [Rikenellaceae bacterium]